jgi:hypothetical protein
MVHLDLPARAPEPSGDGQAVSREIESTNDGDVYLEGSGPVSWDGRQLDAGGATGCRAGLNLGADADTAAASANRYSPLVMKGGRAARKLAVGVGGGALVLTGLVLIPLPGPGTVVLIGGLAVLQKEYPSAGRLLRRIERPALRWAAAIAIRRRERERLTENGANRSIAPSPHPGDPTGG